jgi:spore germination protein GerM
VKKKNPKGTYYVPRVKHAEASDDNVKVAEALAVLISGRSDEYQATNNEPDI